jgi:serine phosphatase RsbU (regulator of sigma subunit)
LFTDGLFEVLSSASDEELGEEGLMQIVGERAALPIDQLTDAVIQQVRGFSDGMFKDDVCLVAMQFLAAHRERDK